MSGKSSTKRDAKFYEAKAKELRDKENKKAEIASHRAALAKLTGKKK